MDWYDKMYQEGQYNKLDDNHDKKLQRIIMDLKTTTKVLDWDQVKKVMDETQDAIRTKRTPIWGGLDSMISSTINGPDGWKYICEQNYGHGKNPKNWSLEKDLMVDALNRLRNDYNEVFHGEAIPIASQTINYWIQHLDSMKPTVIGYKDLVHWIPKIKNLIWSKKPGTFISDLEGNVAEYLKSEDTFKSIAENAEKENSEIDKNKINNLKQYLETLNKIYKETFNY